MKTVAIVGYGTMGRAIGHILSGRYHILGLDQNDNLDQVQQADFVILAVKPQSFDELSEQLRPFMSRQTIISVMAGLQCEHISSRLNINVLVRTMPNLGIAKGKSVTAVYAFGQTSMTELSSMFDLWGEIIWLDKESDFDGFTALAGCGPAYFLELTNQLQRAAEELGFNAEIARQIANGTLASAASMLDGSSAAEKVNQVASKGGATEAALTVLETHNFSQIIGQAVQAARARSKELSS